MIEARDLRPVAVVIAPSPLGPLGEREVAADQQQWMGEGQSAPTPRPIGAKRTVLYSQL